jgi:hypothetical protein
MNRNFIKPAVIILCVLAWVFNIHEAYECFHQPRTIRPTTRLITAQFIPVLDSLDKIAHNCPPESLFKIMNMPLEDPFKAASSATAFMRVKGYVRESLTVRGLLLQRTHFAIIVDSQGKTWICKQGDSIGPQKIVTIAQTGVTIVDPAGTYVLPR